MATGSKRTLGKKIRKAKTLRQNRNMPTWIVMKTKGRIRYSPHSRRHWRTSKLDLS
ncbi:MAG: 50S ribosomal protein L39e [Promethearchaeota archaeon]|nr:MAG: 50S ribosomal protein L39e [Candidatus Lokiarchaeota archaeon]